MSCMKDITLDWPSFNLEVQASHLTTSPHATITMTWHSSSEVASHGNVQGSVDNQVMFALCIARVKLQDMTRRSTDLSSSPAHDRTLEWARCPETSDGLYSRLYPRHC